MSLVLGIESSCDETAAALVDGERLFHTPQGRRMWEDAARANVARELAGLREG